MLKVWRNIPVCRICQFILAICNAKSIQKTATSKNNSYDHMFDDLH